MALDDQKRLNARNYLQAARSRYDSVGSNGMISIGLVLLAAIIYLLFAAAAPRMVDDGTKRTPTTAVSAVESTNSSDSGR